MFYVIGSEDQSRVLLHTAPANRTKGVVEQFGTSGVPIPCRMNRLIMSQYGRTFLFSCYVAAYRCTTIIQIMCYAVKIASPLAIFGTTENENQRLQKKFSLPVRTFSREISMGKIILSNMGRIFKANFRPSWSEVQNPTSAQLGQKLKITSPQFAEKWDNQLRHRLCRS